MASVPAAPCGWDGHLQRPTRPGARSWGRQTRVSRSATDDCGQPSGHRRRLADLDGLFLQILQFPVADEGCQKVLPPQPAWTSVPRHLVAESKQEVTPSRADHRSQFRNQLPGVLVTEQME